MQVKTFTGPDPAAVMALIKREFGPEAVILSSKDYRKEGVRVHEVVAGLEQQEYAYTQAGQPAGAAKGAPAGWEAWHKDWVNIKDHLYALMRPAIQWERLSPRHRVALEFLQREGVHDQLVMDLYHKLAGNQDASILEVLGEKARVRSWNAGEWQEKVHIITGPYGAGKTTSLIRMALLLRKADPSLNIAVINTDCTRGTGRVVLRHWAELSDFRYFEATDIAGMFKAFKAAADADIIFVDTPGIDRNTTISQHLEAFGLGGVGAAQHIVLAPHYGENYMADMVRRYQSGLPGSLIWSKLDESTGFAGMINVAAMTSLPISCLSYGPGLRGSLSAASPTMLWRLVFKHQLPDHDAISGEAA